MKIKRQVTREFADRLYEEAMDAQFEAEVRYEKWIRCWRTLAQDFFWRVANAHLSDMRPCNPCCTGLIHWNDGKERIQVVRFSSPFRSCEIFPQIEYRSQIKSGGFGKTIYRVDAPYMLSHFEADQKAEE